MNDQQPKPERSTDTLQVGVLPVQSFTSPAIPIVPGMPLEPRYGRPDTYTRYGIGPKPAASDQPKEAQQ
jgi:hypothetical protein